jgi:hypothetical protein
MKKEEKKNCLPVYFILFLAKEECKIFRFLSQDYFFLIEVDAFY